MKTFTNRALAILALVAGMWATAAAQTLDGVPVIHGNIVGPAANVDYTSGIYNFAAQAPLNLRLEKQSLFIAVNGGGDFVNGMYHYISSNDGLGTSYDYRMYLYDADTWIPKDNFRIPGNYAATDLSYDISTDRLYGCFTNDNSIFTFGWMEPATGVFHPINKVPGSYAVVAVNRMGQVYAINQEGKLMLLNKMTGEEHLIGDTGLIPSGSQSGCFDPTFPGFYWCYRDAENHTALYNVSAIDGASELIAPFPMDEIVTGAYIRPSSVDGDRIPGKPEIKLLKYTETGVKLSFTLPATMESNASITGEVEYNVLVDGIIVKSAMGNPGEQIEMDIPLTEGEHLLDIFPCKNNMVGKHDGEAFYFGADAPRPVTNVRAARSGDTFTATWDAPTEGAHGSAINPADLTYEVKLHIGDKLSQVTEITGTRFEATPDISESTPCYAEVVAICGTNGKRSEAAQSNSVLMGPCTPLPFSANFDNGEGTENFMAFDANGDGVTWYYEKIEGNMRTNYKSGNGSMDDWLFTPNFLLSPEEFYHVQVRVATPGQYYTPETLAIRAGLNRTPEAMTVEVLPPTDYATPAVGTLVDAYFVPTEEGAWHLGFHSTTKGENLYVSIDDLKIASAGVTSAPAAPTGLKATTAAGGALKCSIEVTAPTHCLDGEPLGENVTLQVYRSGRRQKEMKDVAPGATVVFEDLAGVQGTNTYEVRCFNSDGYGIPATVRAYLGVDKPLPPTNVHVTFDKDRKPVITWDAPEGGVNGGVIDYSAVTYNIRRSFDSQYVAQGLKGNTVTDNLGLDVVQQALMFYNVYAVTAAGTSEPAQTEHFTMGTPYEMPYYEGFEDMLEMKGPWLGMLLDNQKGAWYIDEEGSRPSAEPIDNNGGLVTFAPGESGHTSTLGTPLVCIDDADYPVLEFYLYTVRDNDSRLTVSVRTDVTEPDAVWTRLMNDRSFTPGWNVVRIPLEDYKGEKYVQVLFTGLAGEEYYNHMHLDCISISDMPRYDVAAVGLTGPEILVPGEEANFSATVANVGIDPVSDITVRLYRGLTEVSSTTLPSLDAAASIDVTLTDMPALDFSETESYTVMVENAKDSNPDNDLSRTVEVEVQLPHYPVPVLKGHLEGEEAVLTWERPATEGVRAPVSDGFESYAPFIIDNVGDWTMHDIDGTATVQLVDGAGNPIEYENAGKAMAFQVFNPGAAGLQLIDEDGNPTVCATHRGAQMMCAFCDTDAYNNDWLVSPLLSGDAQTVSFFARSFVGSYGREAMIIMVSDSGTAVEDFRELTDVVEVPVDWTRYTVDLPAGTRHFAIRCVSIDQLALCIDDVKYIPESSAPVDLVLSGYNLYCDGTMVQQLGADATSYRVPRDAAHGLYRLSAIYHLGESAHSAPVDTDNLAGVENVATDAHEGAPCDVYTLQGVLILRNASADDIRRLAPGIYLAAGRKIVVR